LALHLGWGFWAALLPAIALASLSGLLVGIPVSRAKGHYFLLVTFAVGSLAVVLGDNLTSITDGDGGLVLAGGIGSIGPLNFSSADGLYFLCLGFVVVSAAIVYLLRRSVWGSRFAAIRDNERLAQSLGLNVSRYKVLAFGLSSAIAGAGGLLFIYQEQIFSPDSYAVLAVIPLVIMVVLGGRSILGPAVGAAILTILPQLLNLSPTVKELASGLILIVVILLLPRGVVPGLRDAADALLGQLAGRRRASPATSTAAVGGEQVLSAVAADGGEPLKGEAKS
jgi:branched-chain amino acid transport system permease protein